MARRSILHLRFAAAFWVIAASWLTAAAPVLAQNVDVAQATPSQEIGLRAPAGFEVTLFAGDELAHDIYSMTIDARGRVVVAGRGYVKVLHDDDQNGAADRATLFSERPKSGAHGMLFVGDDLFATGDDGLWVIRDANSDGVADDLQNTADETSDAPRSREKWTYLKHPEHGANAIVHGPDGWIYVVCGNDAAVTSKLATRPGSPVREPNCGTILRFAPDGQASEILAHGFRNPYDADFGPLGELFTVDADGERDHHLPWYAPTRLFDVAQGMHHGWLLSGWQRSWNRPASYFDNVERLVEIGRGSPTGLTVYRHTQFPERYRGSVLTACWTLGRVYHLPLAPEGSTYTSPPEAEVFLETTGEVGFAPVDLAVGPAGDLFIAIGGRGTRGGIFRVTYRGDDRTEPAPPQDSVNAVLAAPQPLAAWSRAHWQPLALEVGREAFVAAVEDARRSPTERIRAIEVLTEMLGGLSVHEAQAAIAAGPPEVGARALWSLGREPRDADAIRVVVSATHHESPRVQRAAWEALAAWNDLGGTIAPIVAEANWDRGWNSPDRRVRAAALLADVRRDALIAPLGAANLWRLAFRGQLTPEHFPAACEAFGEADDDRQRLDCIRLMQLALGDIDTQQMQQDVYAGYALRADEAQLAAAASHGGAKLAAAFPLADRAANRELARLVAMLGVDDTSLVERIAAELTAESHPTDDLHYLICLSRLPAARSELATERVAAGLARLQPKMQAASLYESRNWPTRVLEALAQLYVLDAKLPPAVIRQSEFAQPAQALLAVPMNTADRQAAARRLLAAARDSDEPRWTDRMVALIGELPPEESLPALRLAWADFSLRDAILRVLAASPHTDDRPLFVQSLASPQADTIERAAKALATLGPPASADELLAVLLALKQACLAPEASTLRESLVALLSAWTGENLELAEKPAAGELVAVYQPWFAWFEQAHPASAPALSRSTAATAAEWQTRAAAIDWSAGDAVRGKRVFEQRSCLKCHAGNSSLGPDLAGVSGRWSREDLLAAIVDPNKDVAPLYQTTQVVTGSGRSHTGLVVYESPDGTLLQTGPDTTIRIAGDEIVAMRKSRVSLMPEGLLREATDQDLADLFAHLQTLRAGR
jgi:putative membrane-bound dehydrogenase-like protein